MSNSMILEIPVVAEKRDEFIGVMKGALPDTRAYDGCLKVEMWTPEDNDGVIQLFEVWETKEHQAKYFGWRIETGLMDAIAPFLTGEPVIHWLNVHEF